MSSKQIFPIREEENSCLDGHRSAGLNYHLQSLQIMELNVEKISIFLENFELQ